MEGLGGVVIWSVVVLVLLFGVLYAASKAGQPGSRPAAPLDARGAVGAFKNVWRRASAGEEVQDMDLDSFLASTTEAGPGYLEPAELTVVVDQAKQGIGQARQGIETGIEAARAAAAQAAQQASRRLP